MRRDEARTHLPTGKVRLDKVIVVLNQAIQGGDQFQQRLAAVVAAAAARDGERAVLRLVLLRHDVQQSEAQGLDLRRPGEGQRVTGALAGATRTSSVAEVTTAARYCCATSVTC